MEQLYHTSRLLVNSVDTSFVRYLYDRIKWNGRMLGFVGPRGVGKTTMLLQHIKMSLPIEYTLYASADNLYFVDHSLVDLASAFVKQGGKFLIIDEVHKYQGWSLELKQIYDTLPPDFITFCCNIIALIDFQVVTAIYWVVLGGASIKKCTFVLCIYERNIIDRE